MEKWWVEGNAVEEFLRRLRVGRAGV